MVTRAQNLRGWKASAKPLVAACLAEFAFLVDRLRFTSEVDVRPGETSVSFTREADDAAVVVTSEYSGAPWVVVTVGGKSKGLHRHIARLDPAYAKTWPAEGGVELQVRWAARFLKRHAKTLLPAGARRALTRRLPTAGA